VPRGRTSGTAKPTDAEAAVANVRELCAGLADVTEGRHFEKVAFLARGKMFATVGGKKGRCTVVVGLEPEHAAQLVEADPRFTPYARAKGAVEIESARIDDWSLLRPLLRESHALATAPKKTRKQ
jgi:predicted DNA-binding protein (MmcQ/YjbR family)